MIANSSPFPLQWDAPADLVLIRTFLREAGFDDRTLCRVLGLEDMSGLGRVAWDRVDLGAMSAAGQWCLSVFVRGLPVPSAAARELCGEAVLSACLRSGLLRPSRRNSEDLVCPVWLYPVAGLVVASDRVNDPDGEPFTPPTDVVFPAIYSGTLRFLALLPSPAEGAAIDLCGGSGIGALVLAETARLAVTADLAERSACFASFNARLNDLAVESLCGDLYEPVAGRQFDLITAHPPFVPATGQSMVYRDGGESGEEVIRGVVAGLPAHLRVGGTCVILCVARDTEKQRFEQRVRDWLGPEATGFDVVFGLEKVLTVAGVIESFRQRGQLVAEAGPGPLAERFQALGTRQFVYGALFIRRYAGPVLQPPARLRITPLARAAEFECFHDWRWRCRQPEFTAWLAGARPRLAPALQLTVRHVVRDGSLAPADFVFEMDARLQAALRVDAWVVPLLARLEGGSTVGEVYETARAAGELPDEFYLTDFAGLVRAMVDRGLMQVDALAAAG